MGLSYGIDLRERVVAAIEAGLSHRLAAKRFCVAISTAGNWHRLSRKNGSVAPAKQGQPGSSKLDPHEAEILAMIEGRKDIALHEIAKQLEHKPGLQAVTSTVYQFLAKRGITFNKRQAIENAGANLLYLSPYFPDFNPIEMAFSKLKAHLKKAAARTIIDRWELIGKLIDEYKPTECQNYFKAAGYKRH